MLARSTDLAELAAVGWEARPEGLCKGERCVPLRAGADLRDAAQVLGMAVVEEPALELWAVGPESGGHALASAVAPELVLPDLEERPFALSSLLGKKVLLVAWASW